jgi:thioredoxin reductase (NADPH)
MDNMRKQAERFGAKFRTGWVNKVNLSNRPFILEIEGGEELEAESLIISTGASAIYIGIPGEWENIGQTPSLNIRENHLLF